MDYLKIDQTCKRNDTGARVRVLEVRPNGLRVFYLMQDCRDGHTLILAHEDCRPDTKEDRA